MARTDNLAPACAPGVEHAAKDFMNVHEKLHETAKTEHMSAGRRAPLQPQKIARKHSFDSIVTESSELTRAESTMVEEVEDSASEPSTASRSMAPTSVCSSPVQQPCFQPVPQGWTPPESLAMFPCAVQAGVQVFFPQPTSTCTLEGQQPPQFIPMILPQMQCVQLLQVPMQGSTAAYPGHFYECSEQSAPSLSATASWSCEPPRTEASSQPRGRASPTGKQARCSHARETPGPVFSLERYEQLKSEMGLGGTRKTEQERASAVKSLEGKAFALALEEKGCWLLQDCHCCSATSSIITI